MHWSVALLLASLAACGPRTVNSPGCIMESPSRYPPALFLIGVGFAPVTANPSEALSAASASAAGSSGWPLQVERSCLTTFSRMSTNQIIEGI